MTHANDDSNTSPLESHFNSLNLGNNTGANTQSASARFEKFFNTGASPAGGAEYSLHPQHHLSQPAQPQGPYGSLGVGAAPKYLSTNGPSSGGSFRSKSIGRSGIPSQWATDATASGAASPLSPHAHLNSPAYYGSQQGSGFLPPTLGFGSDAALVGADDDDVIPTAIVVKNIPFSVKKEQLLQIIQDLSIPMPYAFNYHFDQGIFRGLAFANFRSAEEADAVVAALNGFDVSGRKLRVEYKRVLQAGEKERIEKEKAIKRMRSMQMEKDRMRRETDFPYGAGPAPVVPPMPQHHFAQAQTSPLPPPPSLGLEPPASTPYGAAYTAPSIATSVTGGSSSTTSNTANTSLSSAYNGVTATDSLSPPPGSALTADALSALGSALPPGPSAPSERSGISKKEELDLNDAQTLEIYSRVLLFKDDRMRDELAFSRNLSPMERRTVHLVAQRLGLYHYSMGESDERHVIVTKHEVPAAVGASRTLRSQASTIGRSHRGNHQDGAGLLSPNASSGRTALRVKKSAPDMKRARDFDAAPPLPLPSRMGSGNELGVPSNHQQLGRRSNGNLREGYSATIGSGSRRSAGGAGGAAGLQSLFASPFGVPPVPSLNSGAYDTGAGRSASPLNGGAIRQPRGPSSDARNFAPRSRGNGSSSSGADYDGGELVGGDASHVQHQSQSHEPLEI